MQYQFHPLDNAMIGALKPGPMAPGHELDSA
jgi:hypothetical protein